MKLIFAGMMAFATLTSFAQIVERETKYEIKTGKTITASHSESEVVKTIKEKIENDYNVQCTGGSSAVLPDITKRIRYSADCVGEQNLRLIIVSSFEWDDQLNSLVFYLKNYDIKFEN